MKKYNCLIIHFAFSALHNFPKMSVYLSCLCFVSSIIGCEVFLHALTFMVFKYMCTFWVLVETNNTLNAPFKDFIDTVDFCFFLKDFF